MTNTNIVVDNVPQGAVSQDGTFAVNNLHAGEHRMELSHEWMSRPMDERFTSLQSMRVHKEKEYHASDTLIADNKEIELFPEFEEPTSLHEAHALSIGLPNSKEVKANNHSFNQLARLSDYSPKELRKLPAAIVSDVLNWQLRHGRDVESLGVYHNASTVRAFTGPKYGRIPDYEVIASVESMIAQTGIDWKVPGTMQWSTGLYDPNVPVTEETTTLFASDRDVFMFLVDDRNPIEVGKIIDPRTGEEKPDLMFRGFYVKNSEVGAATLKVATFYMRAVCANRIMWGVENFEEINIRHTKNAYSRFMQEVVPALQSYTNGSERTLIEGVQKAKQAIVAKEEDDALKFLTKRKFSKRRAKDILNIVEVEEGHTAKTAWDMAQGITALARSVPNNDTRVEMELAARSILDKAAA